MKDIKTIIFDGIFNRFNNTDTLDAIIDSIGDDRDIDDLPAPYPDDEYYLVISSEKEDNFFFGIYLNSNEEVEFIKSVFRVFDPIMDLYSFYNKDDVPQHLWTED